MKAVDTDNTNWLKDVISSKGWPTISMVGQAGGEDAWLLIQRAEVGLPPMAEYAAMLEKMMSGK